MSRHAAGSIVALVARREIVTRLRSRVFQVTTAISMLALVGMTIVAQFISDDSEPAASVGLAGVGAGASEQLVAAGVLLGVDLETESIEDIGRGRARVRDGDLDVLLVADRSGFTAYTDDDLEPDIENALGVAATRIALDQTVVDLGGTSAQVDAALAASGVRVENLEEDRFDVERIVIDSIAGLLIYLALLLYGQMVAQGVVEEKASRIVEILLATIRPWQLMAGKVLGIGAIGLLQLVVLSGTGAAAATLTGALTLSWAVLGGIVTWLIVWFLLGFAVYALVFGACGALVSRQEDIAAVVTPATMVVVIGFVAGISVLPSDPANGVVRVMSLIPFFSPTLMPMRLAIGGVPWWEATLAVVATLALIPVLVAFGGRIYRNSVLRTGVRIRLADALRRD